MNRPWCRPSVALAATALSMAASPVLAGTGLGPLYGMKYESRGISQTVISDDGRVAMSIEEIETINCSGCDTVWYAPGRIFHLRNVTKEPLCVVLNFTRDDTRAEHWGSGEVHYIKAGKTLAKAGGVYDFSDGNDSVAVDTGFSFSIETWKPRSKNDCS